MTGEKQKMSYILEALKKAEENRRKTEQPGRLGDLDQTVTRAQRLRYLPHLLVAALLINAGMFLWWLHPWEKTKQAAVVSSTPLPQTSVTPSVQGPPRVEEKISVPAKNYNQPSVGDSKKATEIPKPVPIEVGAKTVGMTREDRKVYSLNDLPPSVGQTLPDIAISGHSYSADPSSRIVFINGKTMREGQVVTGDLKLEQITSDGIILSYQGYRFRKGVF